MATVFGLFLYCIVIFANACSGHGSTTQQPLLHTGNDTLISQKLFWELEELARIVDISYCVGTAGLGIQKPFQCASRCADPGFERFELVTVSCCMSHSIVVAVLTVLGMEYRAISI